MDYTLRYEEEHYRLDRPLDTLVENDKASKEGTLDLETSSRFKVMLEDLKSWPLESSILDGRNTPH